MTLFFNPETFPQVAPFAHSLKKALIDYLPASSSRLYILLDSNSIPLVTKISLRKIPFIPALQGNLKISHLFRFFSADFFEAALICLVSSIHHFFFAALYTFFALGTLGLSKQLNFVCKKHWHHAMVAAAFCGISVIGSVLPVVAAALTFKFLKSSFDALKNDWKKDGGKFEAPLVEEIKLIYDRNKVHVAQFLIANFGMAYYTDIQHLKISFDNKIGQVANLQGLGSLLKTTYQGFKKGANQKVICVNCHREVLPEEKKEEKRDESVKSSFFNRLLYTR